MFISESKSLTAMILFEKVLKSSLLLYRSSVYLKDSGLKRSETFVTNDWITTD